MIRLVLPLLLFLATGAALAQADAVEVFYLGAPDCPFCRQWESHTRPGFLASPEGKVVHSDFGTDGFEKVFLPALKKALAGRSLEKI